MTTSPWHDLDGKPLNQKAAREALTNLPNTGESIPFHHYRENDGRFQVTPDYLLEFLKPLFKQFDRVLFDELGKSLPAKPLRDWLKSCPAELITLRFVKGNTFTAYPCDSRHYRTDVTADGIMIEYSADGLRTRAFFACAPKPDPKALVMPAQFAQ